MMGQEVREQIMDARNRGVTVAELSRCYGVSERSIYELQALYRKTGSVAAQTHKRGRKAKISPEQIQAIDEALQKVPDLTLNELKEQLHLPIQVSRLSQIVRKLGYTYKKNDSRQRAGQARCARKARAVGEENRRNRRKSSCISG